MGSVDDLIIVGDEAYTPAELEDALRRTHCRICHGCNHRTILGPAQIAEIRQRARVGRGGNIRALAAEFGVSKRTIHRWVSGQFKLPEERAA